MRGIPEIMFCRILLLMWSFEALPSVDRWHLGAPVWCPMAVWVVKQFSGLRVFFMLRAASSSNLQETSLEELLDLTMPQQRAFLNWAGLQKELPRP